MPAPSYASWVLLVLVLAGVGAGRQAFASGKVLERARQLLGEANARQAFEELARLERELTGTIDYDYLYGVAALDTGNIEVAVSAFERVLAMKPNHAGAQLDLSRAYFMSGAFELAEAGFRKLADTNPPPAARSAIARYLEAIEARKRRSSAGAAAWTEVGVGYDDNITGVPTDFGAAAQQSFGIAGIEATGNSIKRRAAFGKVGAAAEYRHPLEGGWTLFSGAEVRARGYRMESDFNSIFGEARFGAALNAGPTQWRATGGYQRFNQAGAAPGEPKATNDRSTVFVQGDWRLMTEQKTQAGVSVQASRVEFLTNPTENFDQLLIAASWLRSFELPGLPLLYASVFASEDKARNVLPGGDATKSKNLFGGRAYLQYAMAPEFNVFGAVGVVSRRDKDSFARSITVEKGRDLFSEVQVGFNWQFRKDCGLRTQWALNQNQSNIDLYDFRRNEISTAVRCELT